MKDKQVEGVLTCMGTTTYYNPHPLRGRFFPVLLSCSAWVVPRGYAYSTTLARYGRRPPAILFDLGHAEEWRQAYDEQ